MKSTEQARSWPSFSREKDGQAFCLSPSAAPTMRLEGAQLPPRGRPDVPDQGPSLVRSVVVIQDSCPEAQCSSQNPACVCRGPWHGPWLGHLERRAQASGAGGAETLAALRPRPGVSPSAANRGRLVCPLAHTVGVRAFGIVHGARVGLRPDPSAPAAG